MKTAGWIRWSIQVPPQLLWRFRVRAAEQQLSLREALRRALEAYIKAAD